jgi:hypothetical protein
MNESRPLEPDMWALLHEVLGKREPLLVQRVSNEGLASLTDDERSRLTGAISDEFTSTGLQPDDEPNARGLTLEELLDAVLQVFHSAPAATR